MTNSCRHTRQEIQQDDKLGASPDERIVTIERAQRLCRALDLVGWALLIWAFIPRPYELAITALLAAPWLGTLIVWRSAGAIRIDRSQNDPRPNLAFPVMLPGFLLVLRALAGYETIGWQVQLAFTLVIALLLVAAQLLADPVYRAHRFSAAILFIVALAYGYGATIHINALADTAASAEVSRSFYDRLNPGDSVCLAVRPGALGIQWFSAGPCPPYIP
jgi:hypothetical protein